jgi:aspartate aminotransferase/aminotransferase
MQFARRMAKIDSSGIRKVFDLAAKLKDPINLSIGQPHYDVPDAVKEACVEAIRAGKNKYTPTQGIPALLSKVRRYLEKSRNGWTGEDLFIISGTSGGIMLAFLVLIEEGDEVIITDPYFVMYKHLVNLCGGTPVFVDTYPDFKLRPDKLEAAITPKTKLVVVNSPNNPTGAVYSREELVAIAKVLDKYGLLAISDEIYEFFTYDERFASLVEVYPDKTLLLGGFSKTWSMTGWRLGYAAGPADIIREMIKLQQFSFVCAPSMVQEGGVAALDVDPAPYREEYRRKRDMIYEGLVPSFEVERPGGAFYIFPRVPWGDDESFVTRAIEKGVLVIPGSVFSEKHTHFRISYATDERTIKRGIKALCELADSAP